MIKSYSPELREIVRESLDNANRNMAINATAGSGKTTALLEIAKFMTPQTRAIFLAFNKSITEELKERLPSTFEVSTLHSLGYKALFRHYGSGLALVESKYKDLMFRALDAFKTQISHKEYFALAFRLLDDWDWYRVTLNKELLEADEDTLEGKVWLKFLKEADKMNSPKTIKRGAKFKLDYTDMVFLVVHYQLRMPQYDVVLVDEAQDLSNVQHALLEMILPKFGRLISVGDEEQAIYSFSGANPESFRKFAKRPNTVELPLSVTYRCAKKIVAHARQYSDKITAHPNAIDGEVREGTLEEVRPGDFILCRNNAPLIDAYFKLLAQDQKAYILGKDTREEYLKMVKPFERSHLGALFDHWQEQLTDLYDRLAEKGIKNVEKVESYQLLQEKVTGLEIIGANVRTVREMLVKIEGIFEPTKDSIMLSTIHKSKGLEADRVFLLRWDLMFSKCETPEDEKQEKCLCFVAVTRARRLVAFIQEEEETKITLS